MLLLPQLVDYASLAPVSCLGQPEQLDYLRLNVKTLTAVEYSMIILVCVVGVGLGCLWDSLLKSLHSGTYTLLRPLFLSQSLASNPQGSATPGAIPLMMKWQRLFTVEFLLLALRKQVALLERFTQHRTEEGCYPNSSPTNHEWLWKHLLHSTFRREDSQVMPSRVNSRRGLLAHTKYKTGMLSATVWRLFWSCCHRWLGWLST